MDCNLILCEATSPPTSHAVPNGAKSIDMKSQLACTAASLLLGISLFATTLAGSAFAQSTSSSAAASGPASPWDQRVNADAVQADAWFQNYRFRNGGTLERVKIHYATLGTTGRITRESAQESVAHPLVGRKRRPRP